MNLELSLCLRPTKFHDEKSKTSYRMVPYAININVSVNLFRVEKKSLCKSITA